MLQTLLEKDETKTENQNKKFHYDKDTLKMHKTGGRIFWTCEIVSDRDIEVDFVFNGVKNKYLIPKGSRGGRVWVDFKNIASEDFDFHGGLSQEGKCWVGPDCFVGLGSYVNRDAIIIKNSYLINVKVSDRAVISESGIVCLNGKTSAIINDCKVVRSTVKDVNLNMRDQAKMFYTTVKKCSENAVGGLSMQEEGILNNCIINPTAEEHISVCGKSCHSNKTITGFGASHGCNVTVERVK